MAATVLSTVAGYVSGRWRVSKSEDLTESDARSRFGILRSTVGHIPEEWDPGHSAGSGSYIGGQAANWAVPRTTPSSLGHARWKESWRNCPQGQSGRMSASMDGLGSAPRRCTRWEPPCLASNHGADGDQPKRRVAMPRAVWPIFKAFGDFLWAKTRHHGLKTG